jgi:hypothetical protein
MNRQRQREFDMIAGSRLSKLKPGIERHVALGNIHSITLRNKFKRMGLQGYHIDEALNMVDQIGIQKTLDRQSLGVKFSTMQKAKSRPKIWNSK